MKTILWKILLLAAMGGGNLASQDELPPIVPPFYQVAYEPSSRPGELGLRATYTLWMPPGVKTLRGLVIHQHGCGEGASKAGQTVVLDLHWQALAKKHGCALMGPSYEQPQKADYSLWCDPRNGSGKKFLKALSDLATR